jgi:hypothetical protein
VGEVHAVHAYRRGQEAIDELEALASKVDPGNLCGFSRRSTLCLASTEGDLPGLRREYDCRSSFGFDVSFLERSALREFGGFAEPGGLPFIGRPPGSDQVYMALGYGGNGITFSTIAARLITDLIVGRANADEAVFRFDRQSAT